MRKSSACFRIPSLGSFARYSRCVLAYFYRMSCCRQSWSDVGVAVAIICVDYALTQLKIISNPLGKACMPGPARPCPARSLARSPATRHPPATKCHGIPPLRFFRNLQVARLVGCSARRLTDFPSKQASNQPTNQLTERPGRAADQANDRPTD